MTRDDYRRQLFALAAAGLALGLAGCPSSSGSGANGQLSVAITDTPVDGAQQVVVAFTGVDVHGPDGTVSLPLQPAQSMSLAPQQEDAVDLLSLQGNASRALLSNVSLPAGGYQWLRLDLDLGHSYIITSDGRQYPLAVPSGAQTGLKLVSGFTVAQSGRTDFMIDFDLRKSITETTDASGAVEYILRPTLRIVNLQQAGAIAGTAAGDMTIGGEAISDPACSPAVYVYRGAGVIPKGFDESVTGGTPPLTSASLELNSATGNYGYAVAFLAPGTYTLAATCAARDRAGATSLAFSVTKTVSVAANQTAKAYFP